MQAIDFPERIESLKAGMIGAAAAGLVVGLTLVMAYAVQHSNPEQVLLLPWNGLSIPGLLSGAIALLSGFLFGVTYRYITRGEANPHLRSGAVLAFALVRGLAQVDVGFTLEGHPWVLLALLGESLLLFAIAQLALDRAIQRGWVKAFKS